MNQGKLEVVKQEIARVNINILGISKLKWTGMGNLIQITLISTTVGKNPLEEMEQPSWSTRVQNEVLGYNLKNNSDLCSFPRQTVKYLRNIIYSHI